MSRLLVVVVSCEEMVIEFGVPVVNENWGVGVGAPGETELQVVL